MMLCLVTIFESSINEIRGLEEDENSINQERLKIIDRYPVPVVFLGMQTLWSS
jgi:hypothetical protein